MVAPSLLNKNCILTPHYKELRAVYEKLPKSSYNFGDFEPDLRADDGFTPFNVSLSKNMSKELGGATLLIKGMVDIVANGDEGTTIAGGTPGMTKGGTGDVLAGLVAGLYATNDAWTAAVVGSYINKKTGEELAKTVGPFFNASDLAAKIPEVLWGEYSKTNSPIAGNQLSSD